MASNTKQREIIIKVLSNATGALTANEIYDNVRKEFPTINLSTVYRTISLLKQENLLTGVSGPGKLSRFELLKKGHHHHFYCRVCKSLHNIKSVPFELDNFSELIPTNFRAEAFEVFITGVCKSCSEQGN